MTDTCEENVKKFPRKKRFSKKTKKGWRNGSDVKDVEQFLEQVRNDEIIGVNGANVDNRLYFVDNQNQLSGKKERKSNTELRCHQGLTLDSCVPPLHISQKIHKPETKPLKKVVPVISKKRPVKSSGSYDLWNTADATPDLDEHYANVCKIRRIKPPSHYRVKPSAIESLEAPAPGASYNPTQNDHQALLQKAIEIEEKKIKEEMKLKRALDDAFPVVSEKSSEELWNQEMSAGLIDDGDHDDDKKDKDDDDSNTVKSSFHDGKGMKKTEKQRKLEKERHLAEKKRLKEKEDKQRESQKFRLKSIKKEIKERERKLGTRAAWKELEKEENKFKPKRLGKLKYEEPTVNVKLSEELTGSLRKLKPEGHVADLLFKHLQKKNIIEPRQRAKPARRAKTKLFEKKGHKAVTL